MRSDVLELMVVLTRKVDENRKSWAAAASLVPAAAARATGAGGAARVRAGA
jgi:hypothetical protein